MQDIVISDDDNYEVLSYIRDSVKFELGYPIVDVELTDDVIDSLIKRTLTIMSKFSLLAVLHTEPLIRNSENQNAAYYLPIDTSKFPLKISYILDILKSRGSNDVLTNTSDISGIPLGWAIRSGRSSMNNYTDTISNISTMYNERILVSRLAGSFKDQCTYDFDKPRQLLYIDVGYPASNNITIEYVPQLTIEQVGIVKNYPEAYDFLVQHSIALSMIALGRARGKFSVANYDWSVSSTELITSGQAKIDALIERTTNSYSRAMTD
jgi:hypothetical protein